MDNNYLKISNNEIDNNEIDNNEIDISNNDIDEIDISNNDIDVSNNIFNINDITMKFLINKNHYDKYTSQVNPEKLREKENYINNLKKYSNDIMDITNKYIFDNDSNLDTFISKTFEDYSKAIINYLKHKEIEKHNKYNYVNYEKEDDTIFSNLDYSLWSNEKIKKL